MLSCDYAERDPAKCPPDACEVMMAVVAAARRLCDTCQSQAD